MDFSTVFDEFHQFLKKYNYPLINSMTPDEIFHVFHLANRRFLISWTLKLLDENCYGPFVDDLGNESFLCDLMVSYGFCKEAHLKHFFKDTLDIKEQIKIIRKLFKFIEQVKISKPIDVTTVEQISNLKNVCLNLFPTLGDLKLSNTTERQELDNMLVANVTAIELSKERTTKDPVISHSVEFDQIIPIHNADDLKQNLQELDSLVRSVAQLLSRRNGAKYEVPSNLGISLHKGNEKLKTVVKIMEDLQIANEFHSPNELKVKSEEIAPRLQSLVELLKTYNN